MSITPEQEKLLTESKYWKPEIGGEHRVRMRNWRVESRKFQNEETARPSLVLDVMNVDNKDFSPPKEFSTTSQNLCKLLIRAIRLAEQEGRSDIRLLINRIDKKTFNVADLHLVSSLVNQ